MAVRLSGIFVKAAPAFLVCAAHLSLAVGVMAADASSARVTFSGEQLGFFEKQIQPILSDNCFKCHSHQAVKIKGNLLIDSREALLNGGDSGPAAVPGEPEKSLLIKAVRQTDDELKMPPKKKLSEEQIVLLVQWIKMGAPYPATSDSAPQTKGPRATTHDTNWWSFRPLREVKIPEVQDAGWARNVVDKFIFDKLAREGLKPSPEADK